MKSNLSLVLSLFLFLPFSAAQTAGTVGLKVNQTTGAVTGNNFTPTQYRTANDLAQASALSAHAADTANPHAVTKAQVGIPHVDDTSDADKPVSTATQAALDAKISTSARGAASGIAALDSSARLPAAQLPGVPVVYHSIPEEPAISIQKVNQSAFNQATPATSFSSADWYRPQLVLNAGWSQNARQYNDPFTYWPSASKWFLVQATGNDSSIIRCAGINGGAGNPMLSGLIEFGTDAPAVDIFMRTSTAQEGHLVVWIDGVRQGIEGVKNDNWLPGSTYYGSFRLNFRGGARKRVITLGFPNAVAMSFGGVAVPVGYSVFTAPVRRKVILVGDSFTEGSKGYGPFQSFASYFGDYINAMVFPSGLGSTGYLESGTAGRVNAYNRITGDIIDNAPDEVIWAIGINDGLTGNGVNGASTTLQAQAEACYAAVSAALPNCHQTVIGPWFPRDYLNPNYADATAVAKAAAIQAAADAQSIPFISVDRWITGSRAAGVGNAVNFISSDNTHPTDLGYRYLAGRIAQAYAALYNIPRQPAPISRSDWARAGLIGYAEKIKIWNNYSPIDSGAIELQGDKVLVEGFIVEVDGTPAGTLAAASIDGYSAVSGGGVQILTSTSLSSLTGAGTRQIITLGTPVVVSANSGESHARMILRTSVNSGNVGFIRVYVFGKDLTP